MFEDKGDNIAIQALCWPGLNCMTMYLGSCHSYSGHAAFQMLVAPTHLPSRTLRCVFADA